MRRLTFILCLLCAANAFAQHTLATHDSIRSTDTQLRLGATFKKAFTPELKLTLEEEVRITAYERLMPNGECRMPYLNRMYTTVALDYEPIPYLEVGAGYTLKVYGQKGWQDPKEVLRHRVTAAVSGKYRYENWRFSLREMLVVDMRADSVNTIEKPKTTLQLRHRLHVAYQNKFLRWKPYLNLTLINSLNNPTLQARELGKNDVYTLGGQILESVRLMVGTRYHFTPDHALNIYYRFDTSWDNDFNIKRSNGYLEYTHTTSFTHILGLAYELDW